ncbi:MAG: hypothetical protein GF334_08660 [Candidatus Altiarchaeales archaeon]|nr:hypothetical protein [Candidatus Altiarchaeales archaeon]
MSVFKIDAPYYEGTVSLKSEDIVAVFRSERMGSITFVLKNGSRIRAVLNRKSENCAHAAGL